MKRLKIEGHSGDSMLLIGERMENIGTHVGGQNTIVITDQVVHDLYADRFPSCPVITMGQGEGVKTLETVQDIYRRLVDLEADRTCFLLGIGGGIVCDTSGYVASTYLRGVRFGFVATTLLAQVDASVGGKNGVNFGGYKNMVGVFNQPEFVVCDLNLLPSLPKREIGCGMAEIVKHAAIFDPEMFAYLESHQTAIQRLDPEVMTRLVADSVRIKAEVVSRDEREAGERRKLNFGHTYGHAIEAISGVPHGQAVSAGMVVAAALSVRRGLLEPAAARRLEALLEALGLPTKIPVDPKAACDALRRDKKREGGAIHFVLLDKIGHAVVTPIPIGELEAVIT